MLFTSVDSGASDSHPLCLLSSFTWLSAQVHSNMVMHFSGRIADSFDREFRCLYADSQIIDCFFNPEEEGMPYYPSYQAMMAPGMGMGLGPVMGLDLLSDRYQARVVLLRWFLCLFSGWRVDAVSCWHLTPGCWNASVNRLIFIFTP